MYTTATIRRCPVLVATIVSALATLAGCAHPETAPVAAHPVIDYAVTAEASPPDVWKARYEVNPREVFAVRTAPFDAAKR